MRSDKLGGVSAVSGSQPGVPTKLPHVLSCLSAQIGHVLAMQFVKEEFSQVPCRTFLTILELQV